MEKSRKCIQLLLFFILSGMATCLVCWQCVGERCDIDPSEPSSNASQHTCYPGQDCQKVYFEMYSTAQKTIYFSTVRSCAWNCADQDDFQHCSEDLHSSRGCVLRRCCRDTDLCNATDMPSASLTFILFLLIISIFQTQCIPFIH